VPADLDDRAAEGNPSIKRRQSSDHAVSPDHRGFDHFAGGERDNQRYDGVIGKIHCRYRFAGLEQNLVLLEFERPEMWLKKLKVLQSRNDIRTIFTDIDLPGSMDGLKLVAAVRDRWPPVHIIVTTGMRAPHRDEMPANSMFIAKPYRSAEVLEAVRSFE
jgi:CheY-like chemotaxis protein